MRLSTRNQLPGPVTEVNMGSVMATVKVRLDRGDQIVTSVHHQGGGRRTRSGRRNSGHGAGEIHRGDARCRLNATTAQQSPTNDGIAAIAV